MSPLEHPWITRALRVPVLGPLEVEYHDDRGWKIDPYTFMTIYTRPVSVYIRFGNAPRADFMGTFQVAQCMPFTRFWNPPQDYQRNGSTLRHHTLPSEEVLCIEEPDAVGSNIDSCVDGDA